MSIIKYCRTPINRISPLTQLSELSREMSRFLDGDRFAEAFAGWAPALDVTQNKDHVQVIVELPELKKEDIELYLQDGVLTISGERKRSIDPREGKTHRSERFFGKFHRSIELPAEVDPEKVEATYLNGVLTVTLTKAEKAKPKQINIKVA